MSLRRLASVGWFALLPGAPCGEGLLEELPVTSTERAALTAASAGESACYEDPATPVVVELAAERCWYS